jgi:catechol 2,3-dioxygenase-like lactoylglutathione lyase family enzyme
MLTAAARANRYAGRPRGPAMYLDYAGIRVSRLAPSVRFFSKGLGLHELRRGRMPHGGTWVLLQDPISQQRLELNWYPRGSRFHTPFLAGEGLDHLGVRVQDYDRAARRLRAAGARRRVEFRARGRIEVGYFEGPDGIWIELIRSPTD